MVGYLVVSLLQMFFDIEKKMPHIVAEISQRHKAEAEARSEIYISPEEKTAMEQEEQDRRAEEKRLDELKAKCAKKGLDFESKDSGRIGNVKSKG